MPSMRDRGPLQHRHLHEHLHVAHRNAAPMAHAAAEPAPVVKIPSPVEVIKRSTASCEDNGAGCETTNGNSETLPIAIGIAIPVAFALCLFLYLHRRHVKKLRAEDANDNHRSLDFGLDPSIQNKSKRKRGAKNDTGMTEVSDFEKSLRHPKGVSLDMDFGNPYMLPPEMQQSHESLHSLSRTLGNSGHDPYRATTALGDASSMRGSQRGGMDDNASTRTGETTSTGRGFRQDGMNRNLLRNVSRISHSNPPESVVELPSPDSAGSPTTPATPASLASPLGSPSVARKAVPPTATAPAGASAFLSPAELDANPRRSTASHDVNLVRQSNKYLANLIHSREGSVEAHSARASLHSASPVASPLPERVASPPAQEFPLREQQFSPPPREASPSQGLPLHAPLPQISIEQEFPGSTSLQYTEIVVPPPPDAASRTPRTQHHPYALNVQEPEESPEDYYDPDEEAPDDYMQDYLGAPGEDYGNHRLSIMRPLPPDDPTDDPEQRANRIRSFYKEYFHEHEAHAYAPNAAYYEDYGSEYLGDQPTIFDPSTGQFIVAEAPYAAPVTRRAMTPPPRGPPRFQGRPRLNSQGSSFMPPPPRSRAYSTVSAGMGPRGRPRGPAQRPPPPPKALNNLPTPHLLKDDNIAIFGAMDFAPPPRFKEQQAGRPASPFLESRPYSPSVPAVNPLASSFTELSAMPSPHHLRKSGTFTALDFAPPPRIRDRENMSDAGSIRSGRSNHSARSALQVHNLRAGAYRLSRIPRELVGSKNEFANSLKPTWHVGST